MHYTTQPVPVQGITFSFMLVQIIVWTGTWSFSYALYNPVSHSPRNNIALYVSTFYCLDRDLEF